MEAQRKTLEAQGDPLKGAPYPPNLPHLPELPCTATAGMVGEDFLRFEGGGCRTGKFLSVLEVRGLCRVRLRARFVGGVRRESVCLSQVQIDPPSSVAYATNCLQFSSPQGEAFCTLSEHGKYGFALWFAFAIRHHKNVTFSRHGTTHGSFRPIQM